MCKALFLGLNIVYRIDIKLGHVEAKELWTFVRGAGGKWLLSAIQQIE